ncbi:MAG TPA: cytochrome P450 [Acidimicrobiales bacterium]|nr:cytochrome P450 [Acidimicrobiales bacterium]
MKTLDDAPEVDMLFSLGEDSAAELERLRARSGILRTPIGGLVVRRDLVVRLLADRRLRSSVLDLLRLQGVTEGITYDLMRHSILVAEGDAHMRLRKLVNRAFTPRAIDPHRPLMREVLADLLDPLAGRSSCELVGEIADHYPIRVMCHLLGVPEDDHDDFAAWNKAITWVLSLELGAHLEEAEWGSAGLDDYVGRLVEERRRHPQDDMITTLVQAEEAGDRLSDWELRALVGGLLFAGFDTTRNQLGLAMALFATHPDQWALLAERPELAPRAVEEAMRIRGAVGGVPRVVVEPIEADGYHLPAGTMLMLSTGAANHDTAAFDHHETFDITRQGEPQLGFGGGAHYCLGANLARAELQEALVVLARRMPGLALDGEPRWRTPLGIFGPEELPVRWEETGSSSVA